MSPAVIFSKKILYFNSIYKEMHHLVRCQKSAPANVELNESVASSDSCYMTRYKT